MKYIVDEIEFSLSYRQLKELYNEFINMSDEEFMKSLPDATHFACMVMYLKERGQHAVSDTGIVHELVHLLALKEYQQSQNRIEQVRSLFEQQTKLV